MEVKLDMPGIVKRKYIGEIMRFNKSLERPLKLIFEVLPYDYDDNTILNLFKELYPFEWQIIVQRYQHYKEKDEFLVKKGEGVRYEPEPPKKYFLNLSMIKNCLMESRKSKHKQLFNEKEQLEKLQKLRAKRRSSINKRNEKLNKARELMQNTEPLYIDAFIAAYHRKGITTEGKIEVFKELQKYYCNRTIKFFYKLNDSERNDQIRNMAFRHLQNIGMYVKLRKKFKGKKNEYMTEKSAFVMTPFDLLKRIESDNVQNKKLFDVFISHSSKDSELVKKVIKVLNKNGFNCYCDWTSDSDFLKRELVSDYTKIVLEKRLEQSKSLFFIRTENSIASDWVKFEIEYFKSLGKAIYSIDYIDDHKSGFNEVAFDLDNEIITYLQ